MSEAVPGARASLGRTIRTARLAQSMSARDLARVVQLTPSLFADIENDRSAPSSETLHELARALGLSERDLAAIIEAQPRVSRGS